MKSIFTLFVGLLILLGLQQGEAQSLSSSTYVWIKVDNPSALGSSPRLGMADMAYSNPYSAYGALVSTGPGYTFSYSGGSTYIATTDIYPIRSRLDITFFGNGKTTGTTKSTFSYEMLTPNAISVSKPTTGLQDCAATAWTISSPNNWPLFSDALLTARVMWEYSMDNGTWQSLYSGSESFSYSFIPDQVFPILKKEQHQFRFRCYIKASYGSPYNSTESSDYSAETVNYTILPGPPSLMDTAYIKKTPACYGKANGGITIAAPWIKKPFDKYIWMIRPGTAMGACTPGVDCFDQEAYSGGGIDSSIGVTATNLSAGKHTLWLVNADEQVGYCFTPYVFTIPELPALTLSKTGSQDVTCYGGADGQISALAAGGNGAAAGYTYVLTKGGTTIATLTGQGSAVTFTGLSGGDYVVTSNGAGCSDPQSFSIKLEEPAALTGSATKDDPLCTSPGDGKIYVTAGGATSFKYTLSKDETILSSVNSPSTTYTFAGLAGGTYKVTVQDNNHLTCPAYTTTLTLATPAALVLSLTSRDSVSCNGGSDGKLQVKATGGSGSYTYTLGTTSNTTGLFTGLAAGSYTVTAKNQATGCNDVATQTISVFQRALLSITLAGTDITCNGAEDGILKATVSGGSGAYKITWQKLVSGNWTTDPFWFETAVKQEGLAPGTYRAILKDANNASCTVTSAQVILNEPAKLVISSVTATDAVCFEDGGSIDMTVTGGNGGYTYSYLLNDATGYTSYVLKSALHTTGDYQLRVVDAKGCTTTTDDTYRVTLPAATLAYTTSLSDYHGMNISCTGNNDGQVTMLATGGTSPYTYSITGNSFTDLVAGSYHVQVKDDRGCIRESDVELKEAHIVFKATKHDVDCNGDSTGTITFAISGGAGTYTLTINDSIVAVNTPLTGLPAGDYVLHVADENGCARDTTITIVNTYDALAFESITVSDIRCLNERGNIAIVTTGGDGDYHYTLNNTAYNSGALLTSGNYNLVVADGHGCILKDTIERKVTDPADVLGFSAVLSDYNGFSISCKGGLNGFAIITATGGNGADYSGYTYALDAGAFGTGDTVKLINAGVHTLKVQDSRGCMVSADYTFTESSAAIDLDLISTQGVVCAATPAGIITVAGSGGTGDLLYNIDNGNWTNDPVFTGLTAGTYTIKVTDVNSCSNTVTATVTSSDPAIIIDSVHLNDIVCFGSKATIEVAVHGGSGSLVSEYAFNNGNYTTFNNNTPFEAGDYTIRIVDGAGCYAGQTPAVQVTTPAAPIAVQVTTTDFNGVQISCNGLSDGAFGLAVTGGGGTYQYSVNSGAYTGTSSYSNLTAGNYAVKVLDNRGCIFDQAVALTQPAAKVNTVINSVTNLICGADEIGAISFAATGGTTPYSYSIDGTNWQGTGSYTALPAGDYTLYAKDINGCAQTAAVTVTTADPAITATAAITDANCFGESNGAVRVTVGGGDGSFTYTWSVAAGQGANALNVPAGDYLVTVKDGKGCQQTFTYTVPQPDQLLYTTTAPAVCDGLSDGTMEIAAQGGITPYAYSIANDEWVATSLFNSLAAGTYKVAVQDANGCRLNKDVVIDKANVKPDVDFLVSSNGNALDTLVIKEISLPAPDEATFTYSPEAVYLGTYQGSPMLRFPAAGTYWVEMMATFGECTYSLHKDIIVKAYDPLATPVYTMPVSVIDTVILSPNPNNGTFNFKVTLNKKQQVVANVYDITGTLIARKQYDPTLSISDQFVLNNTISGTYLLRIVSVNDSKDVMFIISR